MKNSPKKVQKLNLPINRSVEVLRRNIEEHADAFCLIAISPDGIPFVVGKTPNPALCLALNAVLASVVNCGGIGIAQE